MPVRITCRHTELPEELQTQVSEKARKLAKFFEKVGRIDVIFSAEKHRRSCEILIHAAPFDITAKAENGHEMAAFDKALKIAERQIKDAKLRMIERRQKGVNASKGTNRSGKPVRIRGLIPSAEPM